MTKTFCDKCGKEILKDDVSHRHIEIHNPFAKEVSRVFELVGIYCGECAGVILNFMKNK